MTQSFLFDHIATGLSELDLQMIKAVPQGGNWTNIPEEIPSKRLDQIRAMAIERGGVVRTTYYGRLHPAKPSYTISTYFNRPGNGCNIHPFQDRTLSIREAARLQSFPDNIAFRGSQSAKRIQVGNAVPVLLARAVGQLFPPGTVGHLFAGVGGLSLGLELAGHHVKVASDLNEEALGVHSRLHKVCDHIVGDLNQKSVRKEIITKCKHVDLIVGGPPCQGWSFAGWHNHEDARNVLVWRFLQVVAESQPRAFIMENVQGLQWMARGRALEDIKESFREAGYSVTHMALNASHFGVPQRRIRVFVIGVKEGQLPSPPQALFADGDLYLPPPISVNDAIGDLPPLLPGQGHEEIIWTRPNDQNPYREWCRGSISFDEMYERIVEAFHRAAGVHEVFPYSQDRLPA